MAEATLYQCGEVIDWTADADYSAGDVIQLRDGRAGVISADVDSGKSIGVYISGIFTMAKTTSMVMLIGSRLFWDHSANKVHLLHGNDRDFFVGCAQEDGASADTTIKVALNVRPQYSLSYQHGGFVSVPINTAGFPFVHGTGEGVNLGFSATAEAQKVDALSLQGMAPAAIAIVDALICVNNGGDAAALDASIGIANGTHATDADSITESLFVHLDGASANIYLESDDGTTEVAATDSTVDYVAGTPFLVQWDLRDLSDIQVYINGVLALGSSVFKLNAATGPLKLLCHMEKTSDDTPGNISVGYLGARGAQV